MSEATCKGCGKYILWGVTPTGSNVPLNPQPRVLYVMEEQIKKGLVAVRSVIAYESHFATCPNAADFRKSKGVEQNGNDEN